MKNKEPSFNFHPATRVLSDVYLEQPFATQSGSTLQAFIGGAFSYLTGGASLPQTIIGRYCSIGNEVAILSQHPANALTTSLAGYQVVFPPPFDIQPAFKYPPIKTTRIGNDVWIGARVMIKTGVRIGDGAIIGAGSVVTRDVPPFAIVGGTPAKLIRMRFSDELIERIQKVQWWKYNILGLPQDPENPSILLDEIEARINDGRLKPYPQELYHVRIKDQQYFVQALSKEQQAALLDSIYSPGN